MSTRIGTWGAEQLYLSHVTDIQSRMQKEQSQVTTGLTATTYDGIASSANSDLNMQVQQAEANQFLSNNSIINTKLSATSTALDGVKSSISDFTDLLNLYSQGNTNDPTQVQNLQQQAFNTLVAIQSNLGANIEGQYLFAGGRVTTPPVSLQATTLSQFQALYNGSTTTYPTTRAGDLSDFNLTSAQTGAVSFDASNGLIIPTSAGAYANVAAGSYITVGGTSKNNGSFTVASLAAMSTGGAMLSTTSNIGSGASITYDNGNKTLTNAATGNLALSFNSQGQIVVTPTTAASLANISAGTTFTINGSNSDITTASAADTTPLMGTNLYSYAGNATSPSGVTISSTDSLVVTDQTTAQSYTFAPNSSATTLGQLVTWLGTIPNVTATVNSQGQIAISNGGTDALKMGGTLDGLLGFNSTTPISTDAAAPTLSAALYDNVNAQKVTSLQQPMALTTPLAAGSTLTLNGNTYTASAGDTLQTMLDWINTPQVGGITASFANGQLSIDNTSGGTYTLSGTLAQTMGLTAPVASGDTLSSSNFTMAPTGDTLTFDNGATTSTLTVSADTTLTDIAAWVQQQDPNATASLTNGTFTIANGAGSAGTFGGTLLNDLGFSSTSVGPGSSATATLPVLPGSYDGTYTVVSNNADGSLTIANNTAPSTAETVGVTALGLGVGVPPTAVGTGLTTGNATFAISGDTVTMTLPSGGTDMTTQYAAGNAITISGTADHNGTYTVSNVTANTVSFQVNPAALRMSQIVPQSGRSDVTMTFPTTQANTVSGTISTVPGTVENGTATMAASAFGSLSFSPSGTGGATISSSLPGSLQDSTGLPYPPVGTVIKLASTSGVNDGSYTVVSNDGTNMVVQTTTLNSETDPTSATMSATSWYKGDTMTTQQQVDTNQQITTGIFASDPAFEKAIRALSIIAQGTYGTAGGLENHSERVAAAQYLLNSATQSGTGGTPPYGAEDNGNIQQLSESVGYNQAVVKYADDKHDSYIGFIQTRLADIQHADQTSAISTLLADSNALQASYQALARVSQLTLLNYLPNP